jgi:hypothetical protein
LDGDLGVGRLELVSALQLRRVVGIARRTEHGLNRCQRGEERSKSDEPHGSVFNRQSKWYGQ